MKLVSITGDGVARVEDSRVSRRLLELKDGNHPFDNRYIWTHRKHRLPAVAIYWQGQIEMEGQPKSEDMIAASLHHSEIIKMHNHRPKVSRMWVRSLIFWAVFSIKAMMIVNIIVLWGLVVWLLVFA